MKATSSLRRVLPLLPLFAAFAGSSPSPAQSAPTDPEIMARYDANRNGRLDPEEIAAMDAAARSALNATGGAAKGGDAVLLSPFEVTAEGRGYYASSTMSGTRLNSRVEDLASAISVVTKEQMTDFAMLDINDIFLYTASAEGSGTFTDLTVDRNGSVSDNVALNPPDRKSTRLNSSHTDISRMPSSA